jgi:TQXA domain-containing protein
MRKGDSGRRASRVSGGIVLAMVLLASLIGPAGAIYIPGPGPGGPGDILTDVVISGGTNVSTVSGALGPVGNPPGPYPATGASVETVSPQLITIVDTATGTSGQAYCIDFSTETSNGVGYRSGAWDEANVPNIAYINYILTNYFPFDTSNPISGLTTTQQVAAVQTAIWYFSDGFVLATATNAVVRNATTAVVADALANSGIPEPDAPTLTVTPDSLEAPATGELVGPFTVGGNVTGRIDLTPGTDVYFDPAGTQPVTVTDPIPPGTRLWARHVSSPLPVLGFRVTAIATVPHGTVYLFDPRSDPTRTAAQKLVLAQNASLPIRAGAYITPYPAGEIQLTKTIAGPGAGRQGVVTLSVACDPAPAPGIATTLTLPAGSPPGDHVLTLAGLRAGSVCNVTETTDGANGAVDLTSTAITPASVTVAENQVAQVRATNSYDLADTAAPLGTPRLRSIVSDRRVTPGRAFHDRIRVRGLRGAGGTTAVARLYGPFRSRAAATCDRASQARRVTMRVRNGWSRTPSVEVHAPGVYTWRVTLRANAANHAATHPCGQASETVVVAKQPYLAPIISGGFSGVLGSLGRERRATVNVTMPAIGLDAQVREEGIRHGRMTLPSDVGEVGWLRRSAAPGDKIGTAVIGGHVSDWHDNPGALHRLNRARVGQILSVTRGGARYRFKVVDTQTYDRERRLPQRHFATTGKHRLVLISCTDRVVYPNGRFHYTRYLVVTATRVRR